MKTLYIDCGMGAAGDMITAALLELCEDPAAVIEEINHAGIPGVTVKMETSVKCGIKGTHYRVLVDGTEENEDMHEHVHHGHHRVHTHDHEHHHHHHSGMKDIEEIIDGLHIPEAVKEDVKRVYMLIAEAESRAHDMPLTDIHFHEVGTMDAVADITAACLIIGKLAPQRIISSPVRTGKGTVKCAHGVLPVPAPATSSILEGIPSYSGDIDSEMCTPTGAALIKHFAGSFGDMPVMTIEKTGYGMGTKDFSVANYLRAFIGETGDMEEGVCELTFNVDDMTAEDIGSALAILLEEGVLDAFAVPCIMKKGRPGTMVTVLCEKDRRDDTVRKIFRHTSTIGIREKDVRRHVLERRNEEIETELGTVRIKTSEGYGVTRRKAEHDDLERMARENSMTIDEVRKKTGL